MVSQMNVNIRARKNQFEINGNTPKEISSNNSILQKFGYYPDNSKKQIKKPFESYLEDSVTLFSSNISNIQLSHSVEYHDNTDKDNEIQKLKDIISDKELKLLYQDDLIKKLTNLIPDKSTIPIYLNRKRKEPTIFEDDEVTINISGIPKKDTIQNITEITNLNQDVYNKKDTLIKAVKMIPRSNFKK